MTSLSQLLNYIVHIDTYLFSFVSTYGTLAYWLLLAIIFCETGLVVTPFLPGDSLLFVAGSIAAHPSSSLNVVTLFVLLVIGSIAGNQINYLIGRAVGANIFSTQSRLLNKNYLNEAHAFYERHGGKTIILARFIPIIRTFAPFVAGISEMNVRHFSFYNLVSALFWIGGLLGFGYFFGSLPMIKAHFSIVIYGIIVLSLLPPVLSFLYRKIMKRGTALS